MSPANSAQPKSGTINIRRTRILVVEENDDHWKLIQEACKQMIGDMTTLVRAKSVAEASAMAGRWPSVRGDVPALVLLDLYLPERTDGLQVLTAIRSLPSPYGQVPVIILSASDSQADVNELYDLGASSYLIKPVAFNDWLLCFRQLRVYWLETIVLPPTLFTY